jgi:prepilin-type N-terminal cleavage/methylation domain-containing protein
MPEVASMKKARGFTLIELLVVMAIISIIAAVAVPGLMRAKMSGNETAALADLRQITVAETMYSVGCGAGGYAVSLSTLAVPAPGTTEPYLERPLATGGAPIKAGYSFGLAPGRGALVAGPDCNGTPTQTAYYAKAIPLSLVTTGSRSFATNTAATIWQNSTATPPAEPFSAPDVPIGG